MRRIFLALALAAPLVASALPGSDDSGWWWWSGQSAVANVLVAPLNSNGPLLTEDAGTVAHVYWDGAQIQDTRGNAWTMNGTVPQKAANASPFVPGKSGAGPYSVANYYQRTGDLDPTQSWWACVVFSGADVTTDQYFLGDANGSSGWVFRLTGSTARMLSWYSVTGIMQSIPANAPVANGINVLCGGWSSSLGQQYGKLNLGTTTVNAVSGSALSSPTATRIGNPIASPFLGTVYEFIFSYSEPSDALFTSVQKAVWGQSALTVARTLDTATYTANGSTWTAPAGTLVTESAGASIWKASTNSVLNSGTHPKTAEATASLGTGAYVGWHAGTGTMTIAAGTATVTGLSCTAVSPGTLCPFTVTVAGTMAITTSAGTVTQAQIEGGAYATPYIPTAAAAVTRNATNANAPLSALHGSNKWCAAATYTPGATWAKASGLLLSNYPGSLPSTFSITLGPTNILFRHYDSAGAERRVTYAHGFAGGSSTPARVIICNSPSAPIMCVNGVQGGTVSLAGTGLWSTTPSPLYLGTQNGSGSPIDGNVSNVKVCKGATKCSDCS